MGNNSKKKNNTGAFSKQQLRKHTEKRLIEACEKLSGKDTIKHFTKQCIPRLSQNCYPAVRLRRSKDCIISEINFNLINDHFKRMLKAETYTTATNQTIPLSIYLREGLSLIHYVQCLDELGLPNNPELQQAFQPYHKDGEHYLAPIKQVADLIYKFNLLMSDWREGIFLHNLDTLCAISGSDAPNEIQISTSKPESINKKLDGHYRQLIRAGSSDLIGKTEWMSIHPKQIGYQNKTDHSQTKDNEPIPIYIQQHALQRIHQRIGLLPGLMQDAIQDTFEQQNIKWHKSGEKRLIEFKILDKKIGYLVCSMDEGIIIIRSFLFLTNSGTPEGNKLSKLTSLEALDKQYLNIDNLLGFAGFDFNSQPKLAELFKEAGCQDLLDLEHLCKLTRNDVKTQNIEHLLQYLTKAEQPIMSEDENEPETKCLEII